MKGWVKYFSDGSSIIGTDRAVDEEKASWTKSRMEDLIRVESHYDLNSIIIEGGGEFHQSDDFATRIYSSESRMIVRRIQKCLDEQDQFLILQGTPNKLHAAFRTEPYLGMVNQDSSTRFVRHMQLDETYTGKWITLELETSTGKTRLSFSEKKI